MRVSNRQMVNIVQSDLFRNAEQLLKAQERVATRKLINRPSDDPIGMGKVLNYRKIISSIDQYNSNITSAKSRIEFTDTLLENLHDLLSEAKQISIEHSNELDPELRQGAAQQVEGIYDQVLAIANTKYDGNYLFAGHDTDTQPFTEDGVYTGDNGQINIIVGEGAQVRINLTGNEVFTGVDVASGTHVFDDLKALKDALEADPFDASAVSGLTDNLEKGVNQVEGAAVKQSITYKRLETTENHWVKFKDSVVNMLSKIEDADLATAIVELKAQETAYEAALATAAKMFDKKSLVNFL
ncbi:MAG: flagellar hook-associated protein FlgL [Deltaproteobacteria bacterium]|nr:flagellar hook-associated protein FlgL [Deltaproteobacteria bacterium]